MSQLRADVLLQERGLAPSREKARALILAGQVFADDQRIEKAGQKVSLTAEIRVSGTEGPSFVSRGGVKLLGAIETFNIDFTGRTVIDVGASTGGFTDCALQHGAKRVYALDVGYGQLEWKLRTDPRVITMERTNIRYVDPKTFPEKMDIATIDVAFISLGLVLPVVANLLSEDGVIIALVKPQFEAGRDQVGKKGVVRNPEVHRQVLERVANQAGESGLFILGATYSSIKGPNGNIEYFLFMTKDSQAPRDIISYDSVVSAAHAELSL